MSGPRNAIVGDVDEPMSLPDSGLPAEDLALEKNRARYSKTKEFQDIRSYWEDRIKYFENFLPNGTELRWTVPDEKVAQQWVLAANVIVEIRAFLNQFDYANEVVTNAAKQR